MAEKQKSDIGGMQKKEVGAWKGTWDGEPVIWEDSRWRMERERCRERDAEMQLPADRQAVELVVVDHLVSPGE